MKTLNRKRSMKLSGLVALALSHSAFAGTAQAAEKDAEVKPYAMTVHEDRAHGLSILKGKIDHAIKRLSANPKTSANPENATNLCVAYAKAKELDKAIAACDVAVAELTSKNNAIDKHPYRYDQLRVSVQTDLSIALSNRGVLFAVKGEDEKAREIFLTALQLEYDRSRAEDNLARLNSVES
jgi:tetratricopeptide (TPR) repeat protein